MDIKKFYIVLRLGLLGIVLFLVDSKIASCQSEITSEQMESLFQQLRNNADPNLFDSVALIIEDHQIDSLYQRYYFLKGRFEFFFRNNLKDALYYFQQSEKLARDLEDWDSALESKIQIAQIYNHMGISERNIRLMEEIRDEAFQLGDSVRLSAAYFLLAQAGVNITLDNAAMFKRSLEFYGNSGNNLPRIYSNLGQTYMLLDSPMYDSAIFYLKIANKLNDSMKVDPAIRNTLADALLSAGMAGEADSLIRLSVSEDTLPFNGDRLNLYTLRIRLARLKKETQLASRLIDEAIAHYDSIYADDFDVEYFVKEAKPVLIKLSDLDRYIRLDEMENIARDSIMAYVETGSVSRSQASYELGEVNAELQVKKQQLRFNYLLIFGLTLVLILLIALAWMIIKRRDLKVRLQKVDLEKANAVINSQALEEQLIAEKMMHQERQLSANVVNLSQKYELLNVMQERTKKLLKTYPEVEKSDLADLHKLVAANLSNEDNWKDFLIHFENVHPDFYQKLNDRFPELSKQDKRLLGYIKMQLSNKEIAQLMGINYESVNTSRYRIRKKMRLSKDTDLDEYILSI